MSVSAQPSQFDLPGIGKSEDGVRVLLDVAESFSDDDSTVLADALAA